jgi:nucleoside-diphosphate-sugar epimerase
MKPRLLITGATGQIGHFLLPLLNEFETFAVSRSSHFSSDSLQWIQGDLNSPFNISSEIDYFIHLAGLPLFPKISAPRIIAFSSTSRFTKENSPNPHERKIAQSLIKSEETFIEFCEKQNIKWTLFYPTLIYGAGMDKNVLTLSRFIQRWGFFPLLGEAKGLRQPVHAEDLATACIKTLSNSSAYNKRYFLTGGETLTYKQMLTIIFEQLHKKPLFLTLPMGILKMGLNLLKVFPQFQYLNVEMLERMNQDLCFSSQLAMDDFGFEARSFKPDKLALGINT